MSVLLSNSSVPEVHALYAEGFERIEIFANRAINSNAAKRGKVAEALIWERRSRASWLGWDRYWWTCILRPEDLSSSLTRLISACGRTMSPLTSLKVPASQLMTVFSSDDARVSILVP